MCCVHAFHTHCLCCVLYINLVLLRSIMTIWGNVRMRSYKCTYIHQILVEHYYTNEMDTFEYVLDRYETLFATHMRCHFIIKIDFKSIKLRSQ